MLCFACVLALGNQSGSLFLFLTLSLSLLVSLHSFCSGYNIDCDSGIFLGFALFSCLLCVTFVYSFWYLQLCLFYFCLSRATILTVINNRIFLLVFAFVGIDCDKI